MKFLFPILTFITLLSAGEPTLSSGHAVSFHVRKMTNWAGTDSSTALVKRVSDNNDDRFDIFAMSSESADLLVSEVWPSGTNFKLHVSFVWPFMCDLILTNNLARQYKVAGPCGAGWQMDTITSIQKISSPGVWIPLRTNSIADSVADKKNRMSTSAAWLLVTLEGADSAEILVANWKTDKVALATPTSMDLPGFLTLNNDRGSSLKVVSAEIPVPIKHVRTTKSPSQSTYSWNQAHSSLQFQWQGGYVDLKGRK